MNTKVVVTSLGALASACLACGSEAAQRDEQGSGAPAPVIEVLASDFAFAPTSLAVEPGRETSVRLLNEDDVEHSFTIDGLVDVQAASGESATASFTPAEAGTFGYYCSFHPGQMRGEIIVGNGRPGSPESPEENGDGTYDRGDYSNY